MPFQKLSFPHTNASKKNPVLFSIGMSICILIIIISGVFRFNTPIQTNDDIGYRAVTPMQWLDERSIYRSTTISEQGNVFLYGTGIVYLWPFLFDTNELVARCLYWLAFPILSLQVYFLTKMLTKQRASVLLALALFITSPIIYQYASFTLIQELWLGVVLLSALYFLYLSLKKQQKNMYITVLTGASFGVLPQLKPTGWIFALFLTLFFIKQYRKFLPALFSGFLLSLVISGYPITLYQNFLLYGAIGGTPTFTTAHFVSISLKQIIIHLLRIPFMFIKLPCYTNTCQGLDVIMQPLTNAVGASKPLPKELTESWIGTFRYISGDANRNFGFGGIIWFFSLISSTIIVYTAWIRKKSLSLERALLTILSGITIVLILITRWEDNAGVPYRHLIASYALLCVISAIVIQPKRQIYSYLAIGIILCMAFPLITRTHYHIDIQTKPDPYVSFLKTLPEQPTRFLIIQNSEIPMYSLYFNNGYKKNKLYFYAVSNTITDEENLLVIKQLMDSEQIKYIISPALHPITEFFNQQHDITPITEVSRNGATVKIYTY